MSAPPARLQLRLGEVWLKGRNRSQFLDRLRQNLRRSLAEVAPGAKIVGEHGRIFVNLQDPAQVPAAMAVCADTPGLSSASPVFEVAPDLNVIADAALDLARRTWGGYRGTFAVTAKRTDKTFPLPSPEIARHVGNHLGEALGLPPDLSHPGRTLAVEINPGRALLWAESVPGPGGLPVGTAGRVMLLLSGGIDSPVAGYLAQRRGCELEAVYFHSPPFISEASREKVETLARRLAPRQGGLRLHVVRFTEIQTAIRAACDPKYTVLLYRRFMYRIAAALAEEARALALCTGENLGQVASQTIENLAAVDRVVPLLTLRPLITWDKHDTVALAKRIGTFETSILPHDDCCTLFVPRSPAVRSSVTFLEKEEAKLDVPGLVAAARTATETVTLA